MVLAQTYTSISANNFDFDAVGKQIIIEMLKAPKYLTTVLSFFQILLEK